VPSYDVNKDDFLKNVSDRSTADKVKIKNNVFETQFYCTIHPVLSRKGGIQSNKIHINKLQWPFFAYYNLNISVESHRVGTRIRRVRSVQRPASDCHSDCVRCEQRHLVTAGAFGFIWDTVVPNASLGLIQLYLGTNVIGEARIGRLLVNGDEFLCYSDYKTRVDDHNLISMPHFKVQTHYCSTATCDILCSSLISMP